MGKGFVNASLVNLDSESLASSWRRDRECMASSGFDGQLHGDSTSPTPAPAGALSEIWRTRPDWVAGVVRYSPGKTLELWVLWVLGIEKIIVVGMVANTCVEATAR